MLGQCLDRQPLFTAHLAFADAKLVCYRLAAELADIVQAERIVDAPGARLRGFVVGRLEVADGGHQRALECCGAVKFPREPQEVDQWAAAQVHRIVKIVQRAAQKADKLLIGEVLAIVYHVLLCPCSEPGGALGGQNLAAM